MCDECYEKVDDHGTKIRYKKGTNNIHHCLTEPAIIQGSNWTWFKNGKYHREDGPAAYGYRRYAFYLEDQKYSEQDYWNKIKDYRKDKIKDL